MYVYMYTLRICMCRYICVYLFVIYIHMYAPNLATFQKNLTSYLSAFYLLSIFLSTIYLSISLYCLFVCLSVWLSVCLSVCLFILVHILTPAGIHVDIQTYRHTGRPRNIQIRIRHIEGHEDKDYQSINHFESCQIRWALPARGATARHSVRDAAQPRGRT